MLAFHAIGLGDGLIRLRAGMCAASVVLLAAFGVPAAAADPVGRITEFTSGLSSSSTPDVIAPGPDGNLWFTDLGSNSVGRINPATGQIAEFTNGLNVGSHPFGIAPGPDGNLWFVDTGSTKAVGRIDPATGQITEFSNGLGSGSYPVSIAPGPDGNMWFSDNGSPAAIGRINPSTGHIDEFGSAFGLNPGAKPVGIAPGPDGNLWFGDIGSFMHAIGRINPATGQITEFQQLASSAPYALAPGPDGKIWFTDEGCDYGGKCAIGRIDPATGNVDEFATEHGLNAGSFPNLIATGADGHVWFADGRGAPTPAIGRVDPATGQITEFSGGLSPGLSGASPYGIAPGADGNLWFTDSGGVKAIGRIGTGAAGAVTSTPRVSGSGRAGDPLTCVGTQLAAWSGVGPSTNLYSFDGYRWLRDGVSIPGQSGQTYTPPTGDVRHTIGCQVTATYPLPFFVTAAPASTGMTVQPPGLSPFGVTPRKFSLAGRKVKGQCVQATKKSSGNKACTRQVRLRVTYTLGAAATVNITVERATTGRTVKGRCAKPTKKNHQHKKCTRLVVVHGTLVENATAGADTFIFMGEIGGRKLGPGAYVLIATPIANGYAGSRQTIAFKLVR